MQKNFLIKSLLCAVVCGFMIFTVSCGPKTVKSTAPEEAVEIQTIDEDAERRASEEELARERALEEQLLEEQRIVAEAAKKEAIEKFIAENIYFDYNEAYLTVDAQELLKEKWMWLRDNTGVSVIIEGHCDNRGTTEYNLSLGERRAESVRTFLIDLGIDGARLTKISYGEEKPAELDNTPYAWAKNRRVHFTIE